jgi:type I restriction enzyme, S subunit
VNLRSHPYESYRASNGEWVDQTPSEWQEQRVKDLFRLVTDKAPVDNDHELLSLYASIGVRPRKDLEARGNKASSTDGYWLVKKGDIVVNKLLAWMGSVGLSEYDGVTSPAYDVLRKTSKLVDVRYFSYLFRTEIAKQIFKRNSRGIMDMRLRLYFDKLGAITVPVPPFSTQQAIATYIDTKTGQIDRQMDLLGQKAAQYGKLKQSLINETITRGLTKSVPMKDSGVEWVGEIPEHWSVMRLKDVCSIQKGDVFDFDTEDESGKIPYFNGGMTPSGFSHLSNMPSGVIAVSEGGASSGYTQFMNSPFWCGAHCYAIFSKTKCKKYLYYCIKGLEHVISELKTGSAMPNLKKSEISNFLVPITKNREEQAAIAAYLDEKTAQIDRMVTAINTQIDKLKDLRKALINDVVTGKIKVVSEGLAV